MEQVSEPRWLSSEERDVWLTLVAVIMKLPAALDAQLQQDAGLSHFEYMVLAGLSEAPARTRRMSDLAGFTESGLPRLSQVVGRLEKRGWVHRSTDPSDGRITLATLTDAGWGKITQTAPGHVEAVRSLVFDPLTKAQSRQLGSIGKRIMGVIDPEDRCLRESAPL
ncbi:MAG TPA: MarR family transcriptional regulator [Arthrobacter bacterium]|jgi:DNA-binding MarR family transcriptional regulator|nr:MarR family transcriptional regulator [Arthrobacter sp.]HBH58141.1 MarR family transcriptional regulator [Arthrobacter sp.]HCB58571.1 MarR family transcriptional regulator [Arthrobacter sp.]HCC41765.1 MarR family transcriptional regulator [Arthrobacter sp.]HCN22200.1 MarR family transcriptional regulator [Arthrobacter sp.]